MTTDLNSAVNAAKQVTRQFRQLVEVGEALEEINDLQAYRDEADGLAADARQKLIDLNEKISAAREAEAAANAASETAQELAKRHQEQADALLAEARDQAKKIIGEAEVEYNKRVAAAETQYEAWTAGKEADLKTLNDQIDGVNATLGQREAVLAELEGKIAELRAKFQ